MLTTLALAASLSMPATLDNRTIAMAEPTVQTITAVGTANVSRDPDQAIVSLGAVATATTSAAAQDKLNRTMDAVVKAVKEAKGDGGQVQTQRVSLQPMYERVNFRGDEEQREPKIVGYRASNSVDVTLPDINKTGAVIDAGIAAGANQVNGVSFGLKDDRPARDEALRNAALDAKSKAESIAQALGLKVGRILEVQAGATARPLPYRNYRAGAPMAMEMADAGAPTVIEAGKVTVSDSVTIVIEVQ